MFVRQEQWKSNEVKQIKSRADYFCSYNQTAWVERSKFSEVLKELIGVSPYLETNYPSPHYLFFKIILVGENPLKSSSLQNKKTCFFWLETPPKKSTYKNWEKYSLSYLLNFPKWNMGLKTRIKNPIIRVEIKKQVKSSLNHLDFPYVHTLSIRGDFASLG